MTPAPLVAMVSVVFYFLWAHHDPPVPVVSSIFFSIFPSLEKNKNKICKCYFVLLLLLYNLCVMDEFWYMTAYILTTRTSLVAHGLIAPGVLPLVVVHLFILCTGPINLTHGSHLPPIGAS